MTQTQIDAVKRAKAAQMYWDDVRLYGTERQALRGLDCATREEAIQMLIAIQPVKIFKLNGKIIVQ